MFRLKTQCKTTTVATLQFVNVCVFIHIVGLDFNDTVIVMEVPAAQSQVVQAIQIFDDEINEGREVFNVSLKVVSNISNAVQYGIQTTQCRIRQSDCKLSCKIACI